MPQKTLEQAVDEMIAAGDSDDDIRAFIKSAKEQTTIGPAFSLGETAKAGIKRLGQNALTMFSGENPGSMVANLARDFGVQAATGVLGTMRRNPLPALKEAAKQALPVQKGSNINENIGRTAADLITFALPMGGLGKAGKVGSLADDVAAKTKGFQRTISTGIPTGSAKPIKALQSVEVAAPTVRQAAGSFGSQTAMEAPKGPILGTARPQPKAGFSMTPPNRRKPSRLALTPDEEKALNEYTAKYAKGQDMRSARAKQLYEERVKRDAAKAEMGKGAQRTPITPEDVAEQVQRGVQNDFRGRVHFEKPTPQPVKRGRPIGDKTAQERGIQKIYEAYNLTKKIARGERTEGQQKLYDEVGKLLALSRKSLGEEVPSGKIANPEAFKEMLRRVGRDERGAAHLQVLLPLAGAALGSTLTDDPKTGLIGGGIAGLAAANPQLIAKGLKPVWKGYTDLRREGFLAGGAIPKNIASSVGGAVTLGLEKGTVKPAAELLNVPKNVKNFAQALRQPQRQFTSYSQGGVSRIPFTPSRIISAIDQTTTKAFERAGIPTDDIERVLLTKENNALDRLLMSGFDKGVDPKILDLGKKIANFAFPFQRTPTNMFAMAGRELANVGIDPLSIRSMLTVASLPAGAAIGEWASDGDPRKVAVAGLLLASLGSRSGLATVMASTAAGRQRFGGISPIPEMALDLNTSLAPRPQNFWRRLIAGEEPPKRK